MVYQKAVISSVMHLPCTFKRKMIALSCSWKPCEPTNSSQHHWQKTRIIESRLFKDWTMRWKHNRSSKNKIHFFVAREDYNEPTKQMFSCITAGGQPYLNFKSKRLELYIISTPRNWDKWSSLYFASKLMKVDLLKSTPHVNPESWCKKMNSKQEEY
jgi:hypothetical protein